MPEEIDLPFRLEEENVTEIVGWGADAPRPCPNGRRVWHRRVRGVARRRLSASRGRAPRITVDRLSSVGACVVRPQLRGAQTGCAPIARSRLTESSLFRLN